MKQIKRNDLLTTNNAKTIKGAKLGYITYIMYMAPHKQNSKGKNMCSHASKGCAESCLFSSGYGGFLDSVSQGRVNRTEFFLSNPVEFMLQIQSEISKAVTKNKDKAIVTVRLNGTSDIPFENLRLFEGNKNIFDMFPDVQFYDYTKNWTRFDKALPSNYHLTFSRSEDNHEKAMELLGRGINVAMVFDKLPSTFEGYKVINADLDDLRFLDEKGVICGLKYKKITSKGFDNNKAFDSGFAIRVEDYLAKKLEQVYGKVKKTTKKKAVTV